MGRSFLGSLANAAGSLRTPSAAPPVPFSSRAQSYGIFGARRDAEGQMRAMSAVGTLFAIVDRTSNATALVDWKLYRKATSGRDEDRVEVTSHAALDLWNRPNAFMPRQEFVESSTQHYDLTGESWWVIARHAASTLPLELWPVRPDRMTPVPSPETFLAGYIYTSPDGEQVPLGLDQVIQLRRPNPLDPYRGLSPVLSILPDLDTSRYAAEWSRAFFMNSAQPGGILQFDQRLSDAEFTELRDRWAEQHKGVANAHRVAILEQGKWVDRTVSQRDMQFVELRGATADRVREAYGISKTAIGDFEDINRASALAAKAWFAEQQTIPRLERIKAALNFELLPMYGRSTDGLEFDYCNPVPTDVETESVQLAARAKAAKELAEAQLWDADDILSAVGLPAMRRAPAPVLPAAAPGAPAASWGDAVAGLFGRTLSLRNAATDPLDQMQQDHETALTVLLTDFAPIDDAWIDELGTQIEQAINDDDTAALAALSLDSGRAADTVRTALAAAAQQAADRMAEEARQQGVTVTAPQVDESVTARLRPGQIVNFGDELTAIATAVASLIASGLASTAAQEAVRRFVPGVSGSDVANAVKGTLRKIKGVFKRDQLGGALHRAQNTGRIATLEAAPTARWVASEKNDNNTCDPCRAIDGTDFTTLADVTAAYGAGPYHACEGGIRCRGTVTAFWDTTGGNG
ncbi:phage portal protein [Streptomyces mirabilis]